jgi:hypothetical protein
VRVSPASPTALVWLEEQLEAVLRFTALFGPGLFRVITEGKPVRPAAYRDRAGWVRWDAIAQLRAARASLNLARVEDYSNSLLAFARALEATLHCPVQINFYATPGEAQGLGAHTDSHDVLVHQLHGRKNWNVAGIGATTASADDLTMEPGDWLFVPRGIRHEVRNLHPEPTTHLAIGLHALTWGDFWQTAVASAQKSVGGLSHPIDFNATPAIAAQKLAIDLLPSLATADPAAVLRQYHLTFRNFAVPVPPEHIVDREALAHIATASLCWRHPDATVRAAAEVLEIDLPYRRAPLALRPDLEPAVRFMIAASSFRAVDLPGMDAATSALLCRLLADTGALRVLP